MKFKAGDEVTVLDDSFNGRVKGYKAGRVVIETPEGDFIGIRQKMFLSHSYDHRVVDGALGGSFVKRVADYLEAFDVNRDI